MDEFIVFTSEQQELDFYKTLTAYEEEFGIEKLVVFIPSSWYAFVDLIMFSYMETRVWNMNCVGLRVKGYTAKFTVPLDEELN